MSELCITNGIWKHGPCPVPFWSCCPVKGRRGQLSLVMKDQPCLHPSSEVYSCHSPLAFSNVSHFACGSGKLPAWSFPCPSCHSDRSIFAGNLIKAKPGRVLYLARVAAWLHICTSFFEQKWDVLLWRKPKIHFKKEELLLFLKGR